MLVIVSCQESQHWQEIEVGKTVKIKSEKFNLNNNNYIFNWSKPIGEDQGIEFIIQHDKILVEAKEIGEYTIDLTVENLSNKIVHTETFYLNAIPNKNPSNNTNKTKESKKKKNDVQKNQRYTIQVASWPNLNNAIEDKDNLISLGYDAYIEKYSNNEKNITRWRVRIGSFESKSLASEIKKELAKFRGKDIWIDKIK